MKKLHDRLMDSAKVEDCPYEGLGYCWIWQKSTAGGYPQIKVAGKNLKAHRVSYELFNGEIPEGLLLLHKCDQPLCINPDHLEPGTSKKNAQDRSERNRTGWRKLSDQDVSEIRRLYAEGVLRIRLSEQFDVTPGMIGHIIKGRQRTKPTKEKP